MNFFMMHPFQLFSKIIKSSRRWRRTGSRLWPRAIFIRRHENVLFFGPPGVGKTHMAVAFGVRAIELGYSTIYYTVEELLHQLKKRADLPVLKQRGRAYVKNALVVVDELGYQALAHRDTPVLPVCLRPLHEGQHHPHKQSLRQRLGAYLRPGRDGYHRHSGQAVPQEPYLQYRWPELPLEKLQCRDSKPKNGRILKICHRYRSLLTVTNS